MYHLKKDKRSVLSCAMMYDGLKTLMQTKEIDAIRITELVKASGVSRATFYRNFDKIIDVLILKSDQVFELLLGELRDYHHKKSVKRSSEFIIPFLEFFDDHTEIVALLLKANRQDVLQDSLAKLIRGMFDSYSKVAEDPTNTWDYFVAIRSGITINILIQWVKNEKNIPPEQLGKLMFQEIANSYPLDSFM